MDEAKPQARTSGAGRELGTARGLTAETEGWEAAMTDKEADEFLGIGTTPLLTGIW